MNPQIIQCPNCGSIFKLNQKPSKTFCCPKCRHMAPFDEIMKANDARITQVDSGAPERPANAAQLGEATKVVNFGEKTKLVPGLQQTPDKTATLEIVLKGVRIGAVKLPKTGNFNLGRRSSDSKAQIKLAPDMTMSRVHAAMRAVRNQEGKTVYQITTIKPENPVFVNGAIIERGRIYTLKPGDRMQLGETFLTFKLD